MPSSASEAQVRGEANPEDAAELTLEYFLRVLLSKGESELSSEAVSLSLKVELNLTENGKPGLLF